MDNVNISSWISSNEKYSLLIGIIHFESICYNILVTFLHSDTISKYSPILRNQKMLLEKHYAIRRNESFDTNMMSHKHDVWVRVDNLYT